jgi:hypothetical protein
MSYVYLRSEPDLWTVGFYGPNGTWESESDHDTREEAVEWVHYLNGGIPCMSRGRGVHVSDRIEEPTQWQRGEVP